MHSADYAVTKCLRQLSFLLQFAAFLVLVSNSNSRVGEYNEMVWFQQQETSVSWRRSTPTVAAAPPLSDRKWQSSGRRCTVGCGSAAVCGATTVTLAVRPTSGPRWTRCVRADSAAAGSPSPVSTRASRALGISLRTSRSPTTVCRVRRHGRRPGIISGRESMSEFLKSTDFVHVQ